MIKMLIVEDSVSEREILSKYVNWRLIDIEIVGCAANGLQGLELARKNFPDIILTDVKMDIMDGITMAKKIREENPHVQIVFLSSYDDFEYAQEAITINAAAYLTKPADEFTLLKTIKQTADKCQRNKEAFLHDSSSEQLTHQALLYKVLSGTYTDSDRQLIEQKFPWITQGAYMLYMIAFDTETPVPPDIMRRLLQLPKQYCIQISNCCIVGIALQSAFREQDLQAQINRQAASAFFRITVTPAISDLPSVSQKFFELLKKSLIQTSDSVDSCRTVPAKKWSKQDIVDMVKQFIDQHFAEEISVQIIARELHFTPNYISTVFKAVCGKSISAYLMDVRIGHAIQLMQQTDLTINEISLMCGYENVTYFYIQFKKAKNATPAEYRKQLIGGCYEMDSSI
jgi:two-component system response regulator YesN